MCMRDGAWCPTCSICMRGMGHGVPHVVYVYEGEEAWCPTCSVCMRGMGHGVPRVVYVYEGWGMVSHV